MVTKDQLLTSATASEQEGQLPGTGAAQAGGAAIYEQLYEEKRVRF